MSKNTKTKQKDETKPARRDVPPGKPPKGYRWIPVGDTTVETDFFLYAKSGRIEVIAESNVGWIIRNHDVTPDAGGYAIRPIAQPAAKPKRPAARKRKNSIVWLARMAGDRLFPYTPSMANAAYAGYLAGYRAAQRRAAR